VFSVMKAVVLFPPPMQEMLPHTCGPGRRT